MIGGSLGRLGERILQVAGREQALAYMALLGLMLGMALLEAVGIGIVVPFLGALSYPESVLQSRWLTLLPTPMRPVTPATLAAGAALALALAFLAKNLLSLVALRLQARILFGQRAAVSRRLFAHYLALPWERHLEKNIAHLIYITAGVANNFATVLLASLLTLLSEGLVVLAIAGLLVLAKPLLTVAAMAAMGLFGGLYVAWGRRRLTALGQRQHDATLGLNQCIIEGLSGLKETRVLGCESYFLRRYDELAQDYLRSSVTLHVLGQAPRLAAEVLFVVALAGGVGVLALSGADLRGALPSMALFGMAFVRLLPSFNRMISAFTQARVSLVALDVLIDELRQAVLTPAAAPSAQTGPELRQQLRIEAVSYRYPGQARPALDNITLDIARGQVVGIVGRSGAGKTTLADLVLGLLEPQAGRLLVDGTPVSGGPAAWRRRVGYIPQTVHLLDASIRRNVAFGVADEDLDAGALDEALEAAQLKDFVDRLPQGLDTPVGDRGTRLSGGQRQRVAIARALYRNPDLLVLDEATSALDAETEAAVSDAIHALAGRKTLIIIAHRLSTLRRCDQLFLLDEGRVVQGGTYVELASRNPWFRRVHQLEA